MRRWWLALVVALASSVALGQVWNKSALGSGKTKITYGASALGSGAGGGAGGGGCPAYPSTPTFEFAASLETAYADNDPVTTMTNFGSGGSDLASGGAGTAPTYKASCDGSLTGPCYDFDGGDYAFANAATFGTYAQGNLVCAVFHLDAPSGTDEYVFDGNSSTTRHVLAHDASENDMLMFAGGGFLIGQDPQAGAWYRFCGLYDGASSTYDINGTTGSGNASTQSLGGIVVGSFRAPGTLPMNGAIAHVVGWDTPPAVDDVIARLDCLYSGSLGTPQ